jgi:hypothetical protein
VPKRFNLPTAPIAAPPKDAGWSCRNCTFRRRASPKRAQPSGKRRSQEPANVGWGRRSLGRSGAAVQGFGNRRCRGRAKPTPAFMLARSCDPQAALRPNRQLRSRQRDERQCSSLRSVTLRTRRAAAPEMCKRQDAAVVSLYRVSPQTGRIDP